MSDVAIRVENLGKTFRLGTQPGYHRLSEALYGLGRAALSLASGWHSPARNGSRTDNAQEFWALQDVSFEVKEGEVVGVIGRNGAGKSTLLKILSRITEPTTGCFRVRGRIGSLLEVGAGFHPELTGRENIYLNGAILGMSRKQVQRRFDEIVAFAEIDEFLDTPVKRYSSGMYVRLGFAIAAHLEPEILIVDEVLAVGDAAFQKKCLGRMGDVAKSGRTVLFVTHNVAAIQRLSKTALFIDNGRLMSHADTSAAVLQYHGVAQVTDPRHHFRRDASADEGRSPTVQFLEADLGLVSSGDHELQIRYAVRASRVGCTVAVQLRDVGGTVILDALDIDTDQTRFSKPPGVYTATVRLPTSLLAPGTYWITLSAADMKSVRYDYCENALSLVVEPNPRFQTHHCRGGFLAVPTDWRTQRLPDEAVPCLSCEAPLPSSAD